MMEESGDQTPVPRFELSEPQVTFFKTFGFLKVPGLFAADVERICDGFEAVFAHETPEVLNPDNPYHRTRDPRYERETRMMIPQFIDKSPNLKWLRDDPRVLAVADALLGAGFAYAESDGNLFNCDVYWHVDVYGAVANIEHIKLSFYLDELRRDTGALRVIPGSQFARTGYATALYKNLSREPSRVAEHVGVGIDEVPSWVVDVDPGDLIVGNFRTMHASFNGGARRRLFTMNFGAAAGETAAA
jgi:ectoine hydroxylase-related dioxygenase (phytanoyl-CoA dioxygenase family)